MSEQELGRLTALGFMALGSSGATGLAAMRAETRQVGPAESTPRHLFELPGREWAAWRWVALRGAGFPVDGVFRLSAPAAAAAAGVMLSAEKQLQEARAAAIVLFNSELDRLKREGRWEIDKEYRLWIVNAARLVRQGKRPEVSGRPEASGEQATAGEIAEALSHVREAEPQVAAARSAYHEEYERATATISRTLREIAEDGRFREAVAWQNRKALHGSIDSLLKLSLEDGKQGAKRRKHEEVVASYWQRYCVKNDTIGFFGPVGWARVTDNAEAFTARPGASLLASRTVFLEQWCINELAQAIGKNKAFHIWMSPRRPPTLRIESGNVVHPLTGVVKMPPEMVTVLAACDGLRTAKEVAAQLVADPSNRLKNEAQVKGVLDVLRARGMIIWEFEVPFDFHPEATLRRHLKRIGDEDLRRLALECLDEIERARDAIVEATGDIAKLDRAMDQLESTFTRLTGVSPTREAGKIYAGRTLVYEDCRRDIEAEIGPNILETLAPPLSLLLTSGRWLTAEFAKLCRRTFKEIYDELVSKTGSTIIDGSIFWLHTQPLVFDGERTHADKLMPEFQERWRNILKLPADARRVNLSSEALRPLVAEAFDAPAPGWQAARYNCPDVMVAADSIEAIRRGEYQLVMGELHIASNTMAGTPFVSQHPAPEELYEAIEADIPERRAIPMTPKDWMTSRTNYVLISPHDYRIEFDRNSFVVPRSQALAVADLVIEEIDGEVKIRTRDGRMQFDIVEIFGFGLSGVIVNHLKIFGTEAHTPRVTIDRLVVAREAWRFPPAEIAFAAESDGAARFLNARRWAATHEIPRFVFVKVPVEPKPFYVDFDSPVLVNLFAKSVRRCVEEAEAGAVVTVTEMLPAADQTWLPDGEDRRYTCELRLVVVDRRKARVEQNGSAA